MSFDHSKLLLIEISSTLFLLPLLIWLALYVAHRFWSFNSRPALPWFKTVRWIGWSFGVILLLLSFAHEHLAWVYGLAMITFSTGLSIPESWVKRRFGSELNRA